MQVGVRSMGLEKGPRVSKAGLRSNVQFFKVTSIFPKRRVFKMMPSLGAARTGFKQKGGSPSGVTAVRICLTPFYSQSVYASKKQ